MQVSRSGKPGNEVLIIDQRDSPEYGTALTNFAGYHFSRGSLYGPVAIVDGGCSPLNDPGGGIWTPVLPRLHGAIWSQSSSAAATRKARSSAQHVWPCGVELANVPAAARFPLRYALEMLIHRTTPLVANAPLSLVLNIGGTHMVLSDTNTNAGYELVSDSTVNGGRWTVRARLSDGAGVTVIQDTGIDPAAHPQGIHAKLVYELAITPRWYVEINGSRYGERVGYSNLPHATNASVQAYGIVQGLSVGGGAAQIDRHRQVRFTIAEI